MCFQQRPLPDLANLDSSGSAGILPGARQAESEATSGYRRIVEYRFFCGLTEKETAELLGVTVRTVQRDWMKARAWLYKELYSGDN